MHNFCCFALYALFFHCLSEDFKDEKKTKKQPDNNEEAIDKTEIEQLIKNISLHDTPIIEQNNSSNKTNVENDTSFKEKKNIANTENFSDDEATVSESNIKSALMQFLLEIELKEAACYRAGSLFAFPTHFNGKKIDVWNQILKKFVKSDSFINQEKHEYLSLDSSRDLFYLVESRNKRGVNVPLCFYLFIHNSFSLAGILILDKLPLHVNHIKIHYQSIKLLNISYSLKIDFYSSEFFISFYKILKDRLNDMHELDPSVAYTQENKKIFFLNCCEDILNFGSAYHFISKYLAYKNYTDIFLEKEFHKKNLELQLGIKNEFLKKQIIDRILNEDNLKIIYIKKNTPGFFWSLLSYFNIFFKKDSYESEILVENEEIEAIIQLSKEEFHNIISGQFILESNYQYFYYDNDLKLYFIITKSKYLNKIAKMNEILTYTKTWKINFLLPISV